MDELEPRFGTSDKEGPGQDKVVEPEKIGSSEKF
jgi:hypothetical protein